MKPKIQLSAEDISRSGLSKKIDDIDAEAVSEAVHIKRANYCRNKQLRKYYFCDGFKFNTGMKHYSGGFAQ